MSQRGRDSPAMLISLFAMPFLTAIVRTSLPFARRPRTISSSKFRAGHIKTSITRATRQSSLKNKKHLMYSPTTIPCVSFTTGRDRFGQFQLTVVTWYMVTNVYHTFPVSAPLWTASFMVILGDSANKYMKHNIFELRRKMWIYDWSSQLHVYTQQIKAWKKFRSYPQGSRLKCYYDQNLTSSFFSIYQKYSC